jgi:hypothetical protein
MLWSAGQADATPTTGVCDMSTPPHLDSRLSSIAGILPPRTPSDAERRSAGYRMIESLEIENFRGFERLSIKRLKRVNIVVGDNGTGKSALLEALYLGAGRGPEQAVQIRPLRGLEMGPNVPHPELYKALWADLFYQFDSKREIKINLRGSSNDTRSLTIHYDRDQQITLPLTPQEAGPSQQKSAADYVPITFVWSVPGQPPISVTPVSAPAGLQVPALPPSNITAIFVSTHASTPSQQLASFFSLLAERTKSRTLSLP